MAKTNKATTVVVNKAMPFTDDQASAVPDLNIHASSSLTTADSRWIYEDDAERIVEALFASLPAATLDRVLIKLLQKRASEQITRVR